MLSEYIYIGNEKELLECGYEPSDIDFEYEKRYDNLTKIFINLKTLDIQILTIAELLGGRIANPDIAIKDLIDKKLVRRRYETNRWWD